MADIRLDLNEIVNEMSEEEKEVFYIESSARYFRWLYNSEEFSKILDKLDNDYAIKVYNQLRNAGIRVKLDDRNESMGYKIRVIKMKDTTYSSSFIEDSRDKRANIPEKFNI